MTRGSLGAPYMTLTPTPWGRGCCLCSTDEKQNGDWGSKLHSAEITLIHHELKSLGVSPSRLTQRDEKCILSKSWRVCLSILTLQFHSQLPISATEKEIFSKFTISNKLALERQRITWNCLETGGKGHFSWTCWVTIFPWHKFCTLLASNVTARSWDHYKKCSGWGREIYWRKNLSFKKKQLGVLKKDLLPSALER